MPILLFSYRFYTITKVIVAVAILLILLLWIGGQFIIDQAYHGSSLPILNALITGQKTHVLGEYISTFNSLMVMISIITGWIAIVLTHMLWHNQTGFAFGQTDKEAKLPGSFSWVLIVSIYSILILASLYFLIVFPGKTYLSVMTHDTFVFFDGVHRLFMGQLPHKDFHTPLGAATYFLIYLGYMLKGSYAGSLELASFLVGSGLTFFSVLLLRGRSSVLFSILAVLYLSLLVVVPMNVGTNGTAITLAMFYNRWGWAALTLVFITYIQPTIYSKSRMVVEAVLLAVLITFLFFLKATYFVFALLFLLVLASASQRQRYLAIIAGVMALAFWGGVEWRLSITRQYIADLQSAIAASGAIRHGLLNHIVDNSIQYVLVLIALSLLILSRTARWADLLFAAFVCVAGLFIMDQNAQQVNIVVILSVLIWSYSQAVNNCNANEHNTRTTEYMNVRIIGILLFLFMFPQLISNIRGAYSFYSGESNCAYLKQVEMLPGVCVDEEFSQLDEVHADTDPISLFNELRAKHPLQPLSQSEYVMTINKGLDLLKVNNVHSGKIITFDLANPFSFLIGGQPSTGSYSWFHANRNISINAHQPAQDLFHDVDYIMVPSFPMEYGTKQLLLDIYGKYLEKEFVILAKSKYWTIYRAPRNPLGL